MRADRKATSEWIMGATYLGTVAAISHLRERGHDIEWIAQQMPGIQKQCGEEAIRQSGLNGGEPVQSLYSSIQAFADRLARQLDQNAKNS
jgi:hypothetical protein